MKSFESYAIFFPQAILGTSIFRMKAWREAFSYLNFPDEVFLFAAVICFNTPCLCNFANPLNVHFLTSLSDLVSQTNLTRATVGSVYVHTNYK